jgi:WD40 repeat protein
MRTHSDILILVFVGLVACGSETPSANQNREAAAGRAPTAYEVCGTAGTIAPPRPMADAITGLAISSDGTRLVAGRWSDVPDVRAWLWRLDRGGDPQVITVGSLAGLSFEFSPSGDRLAAAGDERGVYRLSDGAVVFDILPDPYVPGYTAVNTLRFAPAAPELATGEVNRTLTRLGADGRVLSQWPTAVPVPGVAYSPDGKLLATSVPELWRIADGRQLWANAPIPLPDNPTTVEHFAEFSPDGATLLVSTCIAHFAEMSHCQASTRLFRVSDGSLVAELGRALSRRPRFSSDGQRLLAGSMVLDLGTRTTLRLPVDAVLSLYLPDGRIAAADRSGAIRLLCPLPQ